MPKDARPRLTKDLNAGSRPPRNRRALPQAFFNQLEAERAAGSPHRYTEREVRAIVQFVSKPAESSRAPLNIDWEAVNRGFRDARDYAQRYQRHQPSLASRIRPSLADRLQTPAVPEPAPIAPKPILIDFTKHTPEQLVGIFTPKFKAVLTRLRVIRDLEELLDSAQFEHRQAYHALAKRIAEIHTDLKDSAEVTTFDEWRKYEFGLKEIGKISFKGIRSRFHQVLGELAQVYGDYFREQ